MMTSLASMILSSNNGFLVFGAIGVYEGAHVYDVTGGRGVNVDGMSGISFDSHWFLDVLLVIFLGARGVASSWRGVSVVGIFGCLGVIR